MKRQCGLLIILALMAMSLGASARAEILYTTSQLAANPEIYIVDTTANTAIRAFKLRQNPDSILFEPNGNIVYSALDVGQVRVLNPKTGVDTFLAGRLSIPLDMALEPGGASILVSNGGNGKIDRINLSTGRVTQLGNYGGSPEGITYDNKGDLFAVLGSRAASTIAQLNPVTGAIIAQKPVLSGFLDGLTFDSFTGKLYATDDNGEIYAINRSTLALTSLGNTKIPTPDGIEADGVGNLYIASYGAHVDTYNLNSGILTEGPTVPKLDDLAPVSGLGSPVPEPSTLMLGTIGLLSLAGAAWRRRKRDASKNGVSSLFR